MPPVKWEKRHLGIDVLEAAVERMARIYREGHRVVVSMSGGKDSMAALEVCRIAARLTDRLPVEVVSRDDEIMLPGTFEYLERLADDPEIDFTNIVTHWRVDNIYNRAEPYFWPYDPDLPPEAHVRPMNPDSVLSPYPNMSQMATLRRFPPDPGKLLYSVIGLRAGESLMRARATFQRGGHLTRAYKGIVGCHPVYDWSDSDIWLAVQEFGWDYNHAYDVMQALGIPRKNQRVAPPVGFYAAARSLPLYAKAFPAWWQRVTQRLPGTEEFILRGPKGTIEPIHRRGETWRTTFQRECIEEAPEWIAQRAYQLMNRLIAVHKGHSSEPFPDDVGCPACIAERERDPHSWREVAIRLYGGDYAGYTSLKPVDPVAMFKPDSEWALELSRNQIKGAP